MTARTRSQPTLHSLRRLTELIHHMPWLKVSDKYATHPLLLAIRRTPKADERSVNEVVGWLTRCATASASYLTDYYLDVEVAELLGGARTETLIRQAVAAGLLLPEGRGRAKRWKLVQDNELFHIRMKDDVEHERQQNHDRRNVNLTMPVLARDGDQCRYCRVVTNSRKDTASGRGQTFDHTEPGKAATVDTFVVACRSCNSKLKNRPRPVEGLPLLPPPPVPYFSTALTTRQEVEAFLGHPIAAAPKEYHDSSAATARPTGGAAAAGATSATPGGTAAAGATSATPGGTAAAGATSATPDRAPPDQGDRPRGSQGGSRDGAGRVGSGRAGQGQAGSGGAPPCPALPDPESARPRGSRGRRGGGGA